MSAGFSDRVLDYFASHAIDPAVAARAGVFERGGRLVFPYVDGDGRYERTRDIAKGEKAKQPRGRPLSGWWPVPQPERRTTVLVCEGESDALAALTAIERAEGIAKDVLSGLAVLAAPSATFPVERLVEALRDAAIVIIASDGDRAGVKFAERAAKALGETGIRSERLGLPEDRDLADWLAEGADGPERLANEIADLQATAQEPEPDTAHDAPSDGRVLPPPSAPMDVARALVAERYVHHSGALTLRHWRGGWWEWQGSKWEEVEQRAVRAAVYASTEHAVYETKRGPQPWAPNRHRVADLLDALGALVLLPENVSMPAWLDGRDYSGLIVSVANGLLDVERRELYPHDPAFFNATSVPFDFDAGAPAAQAWTDFLASLWGDDDASTRALAEWFGYIVSGRLDLHKIALIVGPTRAGKGVIGRTLGRLVGVENVAGPTLSSLSSDFGLAPLLAKTLAVVSDARLNGRGANVVVERLLSISGEDTLTVNRKYRDQWTGKLPARLMLCSNELPQLGDASMAIAGRFIPLLLTKSFYGQEDLGLEDRLAGELPGILNWALDGLERLGEQDRFTRPAHVEDIIRTLQDLASPVGAFVRDCCETGPEEAVPVDGLYDAYRWWAEANGHIKSTKQVFGRDVRAALGGRLKVTQPRDVENRARVYLGIGLTADAKADLALHAAERGGR